MKYIPGTLFGAGLLVCSCVIILVFWARVRRGQQGAGRRRSSHTRRRRRSTGSQSQSQRHRTSSSATSGQRVIVVPQASPFANPNAPPPYAPSVNKLSSDPPPYTPRMAPYTPPSIPQELPPINPPTDEPPAYLAPPDYEPE